MTTDQVILRVNARAGDAVELAIERGVAYVKKQQLPSGAWLAMEYFEPRTSALHLVTLAFIGRVPPVEARATARFLATLQLPDGGFPPYPFAKGGELAATALVYAALYVADLDEQRPVRERALAFINARGGIDAVIQKLYSAGDMTALYLAMVGLVDPFALPDPHLAFMLAPPALELMLKKINAGVVEGVIFLAAVTRYLREQQKPSPAPLRWVHEAEAQKCIEFVEGWLNPNGNNNGTTVQTDQAIGTLFALGRSPESVSIYSALSWFNKLKIWDERGLHLRAFTNENWVTALALRALLNAGVSRDDPTIGDGLDYLCWSQSKLPMPVTNLRRENAHLTGGWGFEEDNLILPDTDDTGTVLSALGLALDRTGVVPLDNARRQRVENAVELGLQNLLDMQSDDGGWAGFVWNLGSKPAGPLFTEPIGVPASLVDTLKFFLDPPLELGEPPVEGLTGRVLQGLGPNGFGAGSVEVQRAAAFLEARQCADGSFWARWLVGYVAATSCVISGLADCDWDMSAPWLKRAIGWLLSQQNPDGGWGETPEAFENHGMGIKSPSMPPLTGIALTALVDAGLGGHAAVERAVQYLLSTQNDEGSWPANEWLQIYEPNSTYYFYEGDSWCRPVEALAKVRAFRREISPEQTDKKLAPLFASAPVLAARRAPQWKPAELRKMRAAADRPADDVIRAVFAEGQQGILGQVMGALVTTDEPIPPGLPAKARLYFKDTEALPSWADPHRILQGQRLFTRYGWLMAAGLFCSSLPQAYCASNGARVLTQTQGMTRHVRRRILETAQFLFDVSVEGSFQAGGRGIRSAQKVRLMHATVRHLVLLKGEWDSTALGLPINQEDLAGTLMTFSVVLLDAIKTCGITVSADDEDAFLHLWKVVGHFLGVDPALVPVDVVDGRALMQAIRDDQWTSSDQGELLTADLMEAMEEYLPGEVLDDLPEALIRFFTPAPAPTLLKVGGAPILELILQAGAVFDDILNIGDGHQDPIELLVQRLARDLMIGIVDVQRQGKQTGFRIPQSLIHEWDLND